MRLKHIDGIYRGILTSLLALTLGGLAQQTAAQMPGQPGTPPKGFPPQQMAPSEAEKAWAKIGPPLKGVDFPGLTLSEVVKNLQSSFSNQFDVILPNKGEAGNTEVTLRLQDVSAAEIFNAMNLLFETETSPANWKVHWNLILNGSRPTAVLEVTDLGRSMPSRQSTVFYVGDLLVDTNHVGFSPETLTLAIKEVHRDAGTDEVEPRLAFHLDAGILVITGTMGQIQLTEQTLGALHRKVDHDRNLREPPVPVLPSFYPGSSRPPMLPPNPTGN